MALSNDLKCKYLNILDLLIKRRVKNFTQSEIAEYLEISRTKVIHFEKGKVIDLELLFAYGDILGCELDIVLK
jgi:transcriptional regulator with XRE-family HTH domain